jgi:hypothetical protein
MRKLLLLTAAVTLLLAPPALANERKAERESVCRVPDVDLNYDSRTCPRVSTRWATAPLRSMRAPIS